MIYSPIWKKLISEDFTVENKKLFQDEGVMKVGKLHFPYMNKECFHYNIYKLLFLSSDEKQDKATFEEKAKILRQVIKTQQKERNVQLMRDDAASHKKRGRKAHDK